MSRSDDFLSALRAFADEVNAKSPRHRALGPFALMRVFFQRALTKVLPMFRRPKAESSLRRGVNE